MATEDNGAHRPSAKALEAERNVNKVKQNGGHLTFGKDTPFYKLMSEGTPESKVPLNYPSLTRDEMTKQGKDHHFILGMRPLPSNFKAM